MILVYTHKITPRVKYIFKHIFTRILQSEVSFTNEVAAFVAHSGPKLSYAKIPLGNEFFIKSVDLLFEQGVNDVDITVENWDTISCFFSVAGKSIIPFDIFAASFYLISRYEEYLPHVKDTHGRFTATQSIAFQYHFLEKPVIDIWAYKLFDLLKEKFPDYTFEKRAYRFISTIDIDNAFAYKYKSIVRTAGGFLLDLSKFKLLNIWHRFIVKLGFKKDPFDTFNTILEYQKKYNVETVFFFLVADYSTFDTNISASKTKFKLLIKNIADYAKVGLHPSYFTVDNPTKLKEEKERLEAITNDAMKKSRQHYLRLSIPKTYQHLIDLEIEEDFTMGYASHVGFRASTCTPFYFYDLDFEIQTPLKIYPFALMDTTLNDYLQLTPKQALGKVSELKRQVKAVNGTFITLFHNESLSNYQRWIGWQRLYESTLKIAKT